ncbi:MAG: hypothetical protein BWY25_02701 [Chloroflexi bacterium ADurb.Bin222]|nr:MAG: hypothetical protein BWY25_02701 [Chloroflexi bacterium ADurb.Bin222]
MTVFVFGDFPQKFVALLLILVSRHRCAVRLVHDDEFGSVEQESIAVALALHPVNADDLHRVMLIDGARRRLVALQLPHRAGTDNDRLMEIEFLVQFLLPLIAQIGGTKHRQASDFTAFPQFAGDEQRFNRLAHAHVISNQQAHGIKAQGHQERHELIGARADGDAAQRAQRCRALAQGQPRRLPEQVRSDRVSNILWRRGRELRRLRAFFGQSVTEAVGQALVEGHRLIRSAGQRTQEIQVGVFMGQ